MTAGGKNHIICLDVGGSSIKSGIIAASGPFPQSLCITKLDSAAPANSIIETLAKTILHQEALLPPSQNRRLIAIAFPGPFDYTRGISYITGLAKFEHIYGLPVRELLYAALPAEQRWEIRMRNDAEAAILGEARFGAERRAAHVLGLTLGTGCGAAHIQNGTPVKIPNSFHPDGQLYSWPINGSFKEKNAHYTLENTPADDVFSTRGFMNIARFFASPGLSPEEVFRHAVSGSIPAQTAFRCFAVLLGGFLNELAAVFKPDIFLLLGNITRAHQLFLNTVRASVALPVKTGILEEWGALIGAAELFSGKK